MLINLSQLKIPLESFRYYKTSQIGFPKQISSLRLSLIYSKSPIINLKKRYNLLLSEDQRLPKSKLIKRNRKI